jgi:hypothetical protein
MTQVGRTEIFRDDIDEVLPALGLEARFGRKV